MELRVDVLSEGGTTEREVSQLASTLRASMARRHEVDHVAAVSAVMPDRAMGVGELIGSFLMGIPSEAITVVFKLIKEIVSRPGQPPVRIKITAGSVDVSFDPRHITPDQIAELAVRLRPKASGV